MKARRSALMSWVMVLCLNTTFATGQVFALAPQSSFQSNNDLAAAPPKPSGVRKHHQRSSDLFTDPFEGMDDGQPHPDYRYARPPGRPKKLSDKPSEKQEANEIKTDKEELALIKRECRKLHAAGRFTIYRMGEKDFLKVTAAEGVRNLSEAQERILAKKLKHVWYVLNLRYPQISARKPYLTLLQPEPGTRRALHPHLLELDEKNRHWHADLSAADEGKGRVYLMQELFLDPRATADALARLIAAKMELEEDAGEDDFDLIVWDDREAVRSQAALQRSSELDAIASTRDFQSQYAQMQKKQGHDLWRSPDTALAALRRRVAERMPNLWAAYEKIRSELKAGTLRRTDFPARFTEVQKAFYDISQEQFMHKDHLGLRGLSKEKLFAMYGQAITEAFPELDLNPILYGSRDFPRSVLPDVIAAVHYRLATAPSLHNGIWPAYVQLRDALRKGTVPADRYPKEVVQLHDTVVQGRKKYLPAIDGLESLLSYAVAKESAQPTRFPEHGLIKSLPGIGLSAASFQDTELFYKWTIRRLVRREATIRFARLYPALWGQTWNVRERIREGVEDPEDYSKEIRSVMGGYYVRPLEEFTSPQYLALQSPLHKPMQDGSPPLWTGGRSEMMKDILPEFPWSAAGFAHSWEGDQATHDELRRLFARDHAEVFEDIREVERSLEAGDYAAEDFHPDYISAVKDLRKYLTAEWIIEATSSAALEPRGLKKNRTLGDMYRIMFPALNLLPVLPSSAAGTSWDNRDRAVWETRFQAASLFPKLFATCRAIEKKYHGKPWSKIPFKKDRVYATVFLNLLTSTFLRESYGLGMSHAFHEDRGAVFAGDPRGLLQASFPEVPLFLAEYDPRNDQPVTDAEESEYQKFLGARKERTGSLAALDALNDFHEYLRGLPPEIRLLQKVRQKEQQLVRRKLALEGLVSEQDEKDLLTLLDLWGRTREPALRNMAKSFLHHAKTLWPDINKSLPNIFIVLWRDRPALFKRLMREASELEEKDRQIFLQILCKMPLRRDLLAVAGSGRSTTGFLKMAVNGKGDHLSLEPLVDLIGRAFTKYSGDDFVEAQRLAQSAVKAMANMPPGQERYLENLDALITVLKGADGKHKSPLSGEMNGILEVLAAFRGRDDHEELFALVRNASVGLHAGRAERKNVSGDGTVAAL